MPFSDVYTLRDMAKKIQNKGTAAIRAGTIALNVTAKHARENVQKEMSKVFDRPTPYAKRGIWVDFATDSKQEANVRILYTTTDSKTTSPTRFLAPHVYGVNRNSKRSEKLFERIGILKRGMHYTPIVESGIPLDSYGNVKRSELQRMISNLQASGDTIQNTKKSKKKNTYFVRSGPIPKGLPGKIIYRREGNTAIAVMLPIHPVNYKQRFDFYKIVNDTYDKEMDDNYSYWFNRMVSKGA